MEMGYLINKNKSMYDVEENESMYDIEVNKSIYDVEENKNSKSVAIGHISDTLERKLMDNERKFVGLTAIVCGIALYVLALLGPLFFNVIQYKTSESAILQTIAQDLTNIILLGPLCIIGGVFFIQKKEAGKYLLILTPVYLVYNGLAYGIGQEWNNNVFTGNVEQFFYIFLVFIAGGLILLVGVMITFEKNDAPKFEQKSLDRYGKFVNVFLTLFALMWLKDAVDVALTGTNQSGSYDMIPNVFWVIRYFDLGITIPIGFIAIHLLRTRPAQFYSITLLFFGFFITMATAVNLMGWMMLLQGDPDATIAQLVIFGILGAASFYGLFFLLKGKIKIKMYRIYRSRH